MVLWCLFPLWCWMLCSLVPGSRQHDPMAAMMADPYQRAEYHSKELLKSLDDIETSGRLGKRSTDGQELNADVMSSLAKTCARLYSNLKENDNGLEVERGPSPAASENQDGDGANGQMDNDEKNAVKLETNADWFTPNVFPTSVTARRIGSTIELTFDVMHTSDALVATWYGFDDQQMILRADSDEKIAGVESDARAERKYYSLSQARFVADGSRCDIEGGTNDLDSLYGFGDSDSHHEWTLTNTDLCLFDHFWNETEDYGKWVQKPEELFSEDINLPKFRLSPDPGDFVFVDTRENPVFELDLIASSEKHFHITGQLWDWDEQKMLRSGVSVRTRLDYETKEIKLDNDQDLSADGFITVDVLEQTVRNRTAEDGGVAPPTNDDADGKEILGKIRVTVAVDRKKRSGRLWFAQSMGRIDWYTRTIVRHQTWQKAVDMRLPYKLTVFPPNLLMIEGHDQGCDENGNRMYTKLDKNCTMECFVWGTNIRSVFLIKTPPYTPPFRSASRILQRSTAYAKLDMGPASPAISGTYKCVAVTYNGTVKSEEYHLYTSGFTALDSVDTEPWDNGTTKVRCAVTGVPPFNLTLEVRGDDYEFTRLDNDTGNARVVETSGNQTILTVFVRTDQLRYPRKSVRCSAHGERGSDSQEGGYLEDIIPNYNPFIPKLNESESSFTNFDNGTVRFICVASGGNATMEMKVAYGGRDDYFRIDQMPGDERTETYTPEGKTLTLLLPIRKVRGGTSWVYCGVENQFGDEWISFDLGDYGIHNYG